MHIPKLVARWGSATLFLAAGLGRMLAASGDASVPPPALAAPSDHPALNPYEQRLLKRFDRNGDGRLEPEELVMAHDAMMTQRFSREVVARRIYDRLLAQFDKEHSGKLTADEQVQALQFLKEKNGKLYAAFIRQYDPKGAGELTADQRTQLFQYLSNLPDDVAKEAPPVKAPNAGGPRMAARLYGALLDQFDHERKGSLDPAEQAEAMRFLATNRPEIYRRLVDRFDFNGTGSLDATETAAMFDTLARVSDMAPREAAKAHVKLKN